MYLDGQDHTSEEDSESYWWIIPKKQNTFKTEESSVSDESHNFNDTHTETVDHYEDSFTTAPEDDHELENDYDDPTRDQDGDEDYLQPPENQATEDSLEISSSESEDVEHNRSPSEVNKEDQDLTRKDQGGLTEEQDRTSKNEKQKTDWFSGAHQDRPVHPHLGVEPPRYHWRSM